MRSLPALHSRLEYSHPIEPSLLITRGRLQDGMVIALEPIISESPSDLMEDEDGWTIRTASGCLAAHHEHTIVIREGRAEILTEA